MKGVVLGSVVSLSLSGCHAAGVGCNVDRTLMTEDRLEAEPTHFPTAIEIDLVPGLGSELLGTRFFAPDVVSDFVLTNTGSRSIEIGNVSLTYEGSRSATKAQTVVLGRVPVCGVDEAAACTFTDGETGSIIRLEPGERAIPQFRAEADKLRSEGGLSLIFGLSVRNTGEADWVEHRHEEAVVVVERRSNCILGNGHPFRRP